MAKGKSEEFNSKRRPNRPKAKKFATNEEALDYAMKIFPGSKLIEKEPPPLNESNVEEPPSEVE